jgi:hypothetical protein
VKALPSWKNWSQPEPSCGGDLDAEIARLATKGVACSEPMEASWGRATSVPLPGGGKLGMYEARHARL